MYSPVLTSQISQITLYTNENLTSFENALEP